MDSLSEIHFFCKNTARGKWKNAIVNTKHKEFANILGGFVNDY